MMVVSLKASLDRMRSMMASSKTNTTTSLSMMLRKEATFSAGNSLATAKPYSLTVMSMRESSETGSSAVAER